MTNLMQYRRQMTLLENSCAEVKSLRESRKTTIKFWQKVITILTDHALQRHKELSCFIIDD